MYRIELLLHFKAAYLKNIFLCCFRQRRAKALWKKAANCVLATVRLRKLVSLQKTRLEKLRLHATHEKKVRFYVSCMDMIALYVCIIAS